MIREASGAYRAGGSLLHRLRPGAKLLGLFVFGLAVVIFREWVVGLVALAVGLSLVLIAGVRWRELLRITRGFALVGVLLFAFQTWQRDWQHGVAIVAGIFALILAASAVTASTAIDDMLDTVTWALGPLRPLGVHPERVALTFSLAVRSLPLAFELAREAREAARARGLERNPRALLIPFVLRMIMHAKHTGAALHARGLDD